MNTQKRLVLFDIDGTLTYHVGPRRWEDQYSYGIKVAYGLDIVEDFSKHNGSVERQMAWTILKSHGMSEADFLENYQQYLQAMYDHLEHWSKKGEVFQAIATAKQLALLLEQKYPHIIRGILTGNSKRIAKWKLNHAGYGNMFQFGLYGDDATNRVELAKRVFTEVKKELQLDLDPSQVVVIGDTIHDIRCGKAIGAVTIAVTTGMHGDREVLLAEKPDILADSLMEPEVLKLVVHS